jgi:hypothetical protein
MAIEQGLYMQISGNTDIAALVSGVYWVLAPKGAILPYIILSRVATGDIYDMDGVTGLRDGLFQVDCFSTSYYGSRNIAYAVRQALQNYVGNLPDANSTAVMATFTEKDWDANFEEGGKGFVYRGLLQFRFWYYEGPLSLAGDYSPDIVIDGGEF